MIENNGLVALQGGRASRRMKTFFINSELYERRCVRCNQREYGATDRCRPGGYMQVPPRDASNRMLTVPAEYDHEFELMSPFYIDIPLTLRNSITEKFSRSSRFTDRGLRIYTYDGERSWRCTPEEINEQNGHTDADRSPW